MVTAPFKFINSRVWMKADNGTFLFPAVLDGSKSGYLSTFYGRVWIIWLENCGKSFKYSEFCPHNYTVIHSFSRFIHSF